MAMAIPSGRVRFGAFEVDLRSGELHKHGIKIKLHDQPFQVLAMLLEHPGDLVTREQLHQKLWPSDTFVDFDVGLNSAIKRLRDALGDSADDPRFVETLPRRGYRLIAPVENLVASFVPAREAQPPPDPSQSEENASGKLASPMDTLRHPAALKHRTSLPWHRIGIAGAVLSIVATAGWWLVRPNPRPNTIAVLPFTNLSSEPGSDYFSDGLTDEIIRNLSIIDGLQVKSRTSSFAFKDRPRNIHEVGTQLAANLVLEGSVLRSGGKLRINAQLVRVSDDFPLWSARYDRELKDVFAIQDEISRSIVNELRLKLGSGQRRYNTNLEAYDLYLKAEASEKNLRTPSRRNTAEMLRSLQLYDEVIARDPDFAPAYAGIAVVYANLSVSPRSFSPDAAYTKMRATAEKALQLDPLSAEAHASMGLVYCRDRAWGEAETAFRRAIQLNPNLPRSRQDFATSVLLPLGRLEEAVRELQIALKLDPLSLNVLNSLDFVLVSAGRYDEVLDNCHRVLTVAPDDIFAEQLSGRALLQKGRLNEAIAIFEKQGESGGPGFLGFAYAKAGRRTEAEQVAARYPDWPWAQALVSAGLGDKNGAFAGLEKMADIKDPRVGIYLTYPEFALLRGDSRLNEFRQKLGLTAKP